MVKNGHMPEIAQMTYQPPGRRQSSVETMTFERLRAVNAGGTQRADFHVVALVDSGRGTLTVDFQRHRLEAGHAAWIAPGSVHRWDDVSELTGHLVVFVPTAPVTPGTRELVASPDVRPTWSLPEEDRPYIDAACRHLVLETVDGATGGSPEIPAILLSALIARLRPPHGDAELLDPLFALFRSRVEAHFRERHDAAFYANDLGYSPRTLARAVRRATGRSAKAYIVDRLVLEAKRLLVHDRSTAAGCAAVLGFLDASSFSVFFRNATGLRPGAWRDEYDRSGESR
ncbi:helix-turn-helix transcriptional regulator [Leifsonia sp. C5G2]|nr:helix-turn-helix transcriptional regulator [Leifsonia sp. C5G2]